ncbi:MAG TPA: DUF309 domain-containing protein [Candidatus Acidoferrales bacterium]|nr:DUF309 domain-containing protein [Candidatus Acidoferrales bacterium]
MPGIFTISRAIEFEKFQRGIALFNSGEFFQAHEAWEEIWLVSAEPEKTFLQGLIQLAAAFHHCHRGNFTGMKSLLEAGLAKLETFPAACQGICLAALRRDARNWSASLQRGEKKTRRGFPQIQLARETKRAGRHSRKSTSGAERRGR